jgi:hypothetical protein
VDATELRRVVLALPERLPVTDEFERGQHGVWTGRQKQHLDGWLREYGSPGYYGRQRPGQDARHFYTHFKCAPALLWLAEGLGEDHERLRQGCAAIAAAGANDARQCGAFRTVVPWERLLDLLEAREQTLPRTLISRLRRHP